MRNIVFNIANKVGVQHFLRSRKGEDLTVLSLHRISTARDFFFDPIDPSTFDQLLSYCVRNYSIISFSDRLNKTTKPKLVLSFDDGYYDFMEFAIPILQKYGLPSNHNLCNICLNSNSVIWTQQVNDIFNFLKTKNIGNDTLIASTGEDFKGDWMKYYIAFFQQMLRLQVQDRNEIIETLKDRYGIHSSYRMMTWEDARLCQEKYNVEIGCHTYNHESLLTIESKEDLYREIGQSVEEMEHQLGKKVTILALPNGQYNDLTITFAKELGFEHILLVDNRLTTKAEYSKAFHFISRINLINENIHEMILRTELFHSKIRTIL